MADKAFENISYWHTEENTWRNAGLHRMGGLDCAWDGLGKGGGNIFRSGLHLCKNLIAGHWEEVERTRSLTGKLVGAYGYWVINRAGFPWFLADGGWVL